MKKQNLIDNIGFPMIKLKGRREVKNLKNIVIFRDKIALNCIITDDIIKKGTDIDIGDTQNTHQNIDMFNICLSLGKFINENKDILEDFAKNYFIYINALNYYNILVKRPFENINIEEIPIYKLKNNYKILNIESINNIDFKEYINKDIPFYKYANNQEFHSLLIKWIETCGLSNEDISELNNTPYFLDLEIKKLENKENLSKEEKIELKNIKKSLKLAESFPCSISIESLLYILDISLYVYNTYEKYQNNGTFIINHFEFSGDIIYKNNNLILNGYTYDIYSLIAFMLLAFINSDLNKTNHLKICEFCHKLFIGRKDKKYCSISCKDKQKYLRKKEKERSD